MSLKNEDLQKAREVKAFLEKNYREHYSYYALVKKFGINKLTLQKAFKVVANDTVYGFVTNVRIENAKILLENTDNTIWFIANKIGLHKSNFIKQFKTRTGKSPTEWRNKAGADDEFSFEHTGT